MLVKALERERETIRQEGIDIGKKEGIEERNRQVTRTMIANGFALSTIASVLALSLSEVEYLLAKHEEHVNAALAQDDIGVSTFSS
jgi:hypothetical protein